MACANTFSHATYVVDQRESLEARIQKHLDAIQEHKDAIADLKAHWNDSLPISQIPAEVLIEIFGMHRAAHFYEFEKYLEHPFAFSQVCRHWRALALRCPMLWRFIDFAFDTKCITELLARAMNVPLSILAIDVLDPLKRGILNKLLADEMPRVAELQLTLFPCDAVGSAGQLQHLTLVDGFTADEWIPFSEILYGREALALQVLEIIGPSDMSLEWRPTTWHHHNLRKLVVHNTGVLPHLTKCTAPDVIAVLDTMPLLEVLDLVINLSDDISPPRLGDRIAILPNLRDISLYSSMKVCINLLAYINSPSARTIDISGHLPDGDESDLRFAMIKQASGLRYARASLYQALPELVTENHGGLRTTFTISFSASDLHFQTIPAIYPNLYLSGWHNSAWTAWESLHRIICETLPLSGVERLTLEPPFAVSVANLLSIFGQMHHLQILQVRNIPLTALVYILDALFLHDRLRYEGDHCSTTLSQLRVLEMSEIAIAGKLDDIRQLRDRATDARSKLQCPLTIEELVYDTKCSGLDTEMALLFQEITGAGSVRTSQSG